MSNHLRASRSPYLKQHSENPVDWYPWQDEAFKKAEKEDKPIFLSIGYSTCHWCHVMAHESFEDAVVAERLNDVFVSIKVDREERPDIDAVYMKAAMLATGKGGWPLSIFMTPSGEPFFAATYIPKTSRYGMIGLIDLIERIEHLWKHSREELLSSSREIVSALRKQDPGSTSSLKPTILAKAFHDFKGRFDTEFGGFGGAPKFPSPHQSLFLLRYYSKTKDPEALDMVSRTLKSILSGGINDHIGGGFHRYSTDSKWLVPHFEKMLYDQAMHVLVYSEAYRATDDESFRNAVERTVEYVRRDMTSREGLFFSAEDADSEGEEGKFYLWSHKQIISILGKEEGKRFADQFNIAKSGNYHDEVTGRRSGRNIPHLKMGSIPGQFKNHLELLRREREKRVKPSRDEKILTDWNAMMISALARAGASLGNDVCIDMAEEAIKALRSNLRENGKWFHSFIENERAVPAMLDDIAFLSLAYFDLYEATFKIEYLRYGIDMVEILVRDFLDDENGGFFQTSSHGEVLISREKEGYDGAIPSGNSAAAWALVRAARMTGRSRLEEIAEKVFSFFSKDIERAPAGFAMMLSAYLHGVGPSKEIVISGDKDDKETEKMIEAVRTSFYPSKVVLLKERGPKGLELEEIAPFSADNEPLEGKTTAYVCEGWNCDIPTQDPDRLKRSLR
jgi:hypothetical protein